MLSDRKFFCAMEQIPLMQTILGKLCDLPVRAILLIIEAAAVELGQRSDEAYRKKLLSGNSMAQGLCGEEKEEHAEDEDELFADASDIDGEETPLYSAVLIPSTPVKRRRI